MSVMLATDEICKVCHNAVGDQTKVYGYAIVKRWHKALAVINLLDAKLKRCGTKNVKHKMLWQLKAVCAGRSSSSVRAKKH